jgi:hypothetical protein
MRRSSLARTRLPQFVWGFDVLLTMEMCMRGEVIAVPEKLFSYRYFQKKTTEDLATTLAPVASRPTIPVSWSHMALEMTRSIWLAPLPLSKKLNLTFPFLREFCLRNKLVRNGIRKERANNMMDAFEKGRYALSAGLAFISCLVVSADIGSRLSKIPFAHRLINSLKYRCGRIWQAAFRNN